MITVACLLIYRAKEDKLELIVIPYWKGIDSEVTSVSEGDVILDIGMYPVTLSELISMKVEE